METIELGEIIASRYLESTNNEGIASIIVVHIGKPKKFPDSSDFFTPYQICGVGNEKVWYAGGVDAVQSLQLVMGMIAADLGALKARFNINIQWIGDDFGKLGFSD